MKCSKEDIVGLVVALRLFLAAACKATVYESIVEDMRAILHVRGPIRCLHPYTALKPPREDPI